jgi:UDP-2-acetamido-2,6-beta-L-arabino-hexul-4-ose reductase
VYSCTLGDLADRLMMIHSIRKSLVVPDFSDPFNKALYATYLSYVEPGRLAYPLARREDDRGWLVELLKSGNAGQIFVSTTRKGITRGNHYHNTKIEKFFVIKGKAEIRLRHILDNTVESIVVSDQDMRAVDIPPGYTHSITNLLEEDLITLFWADEIFDPDRPDTNFLKV